MTPEEKRIVQLAISERVQLADLYGFKPLDDAITALIYNCPQCNTATHVCPGCGADVQHGDVACPICTDTPRDPAMLVPVLDPERPITVSAEREQLRAQLEQYGQGVLQEWMRIIELDTPDIALTGQARVTWENDSGDCHVGERPLDDEYGRFRLTVTAVDLGPVPPIVPENDLGVYGIDDERSGEPISAGQEEQLEGWGRDMAAAVDEEAGELWVQRTFADVRAGDCIRLGSGAPEARITARYLHPSEDPTGRTWHVVPSGEVGPWAHKSDMVVQPGEVVLCSSDINAGQPYRFKPEVPVEIWLPHRAVLRAIEAWGWSKRLDNARSGL